MSRQLSRAWSSRLKPRWSRRLRHALERSRRTLRLQLYWRVPIPRHAPPVPPSTGRLRVLRGEPAAPAWSSDGRKFLVDLERQNVHMLVTDEVSAVMTSQHVMRLHAL